ncbi:MAG: hypothetical protein FWC69_05625, partial [Defluviitaleaceae bacterium]|nr:hypothetical protein [Defluviitaleaceae bacterium]
MIKKTIINTREKIKNLTQKPLVQKALFIYMGLFPLVLFLMLETLNPASRNGLMTFSSLNSIVLMLLSALFVFILATVFYTLIGSVFFSFAATTFILLIAYIVNYIKIATTGQVFVPMDIALAGDALTVSGWSVIFLARPLILNIFLIALMHLPLIFVKFKKLNLKKRIITLLSSVLLFFLVFVSSFYSNLVMPLMEGQVRDTPLTVLYRQSGFILGFHTTLLNHNSRRHDAYDASRILAAYFEDRGITLPQDEPPQQIQPNVIIIMSEAFMDPTDFYNVNFSRDPVPNFRRLAEASISGDVVVPVFGGGTANTEFELLTGVPIFFMGSAYYIPYTNLERYFASNVYTA